MSHASLKPWNYALVQHPMWLIIAEDSVCAERIPPWGCATLEDYAERLSLSLTALEKFPQLHVNFDFSAVELEDLSELYPDLMRRMQNLTTQGRLSFVNGTYSQPHLQILSVESAIRQYQYGLRSIEKLFGYKVTCYAAQEPGLTPQLPQILRAFGYESSTTPDFPCGIVLWNGHIQHWDKRWEWLGGDDLVNWRAKDGTTIPLWLKTAGYPDELGRSNDAQHGLLHSTRLRVDMPDMVEVSEDWVKEVESVCNFSQLDRTLAKLAQTNPPEAIAYVDANYAYSEGADAEELSRVNTRAESALLSLEAIKAFFSSPNIPKFDFNSAWLTFLKAQHHDAYWIGAPELRAKSIDWLNDLTKTINDEISKTAITFANQLPSPPQGTTPILSLHPYARPHKAVIGVDIDSSKLSLIDVKGRKIPVQSYGSKAVMVSSASGLGYQTYFAKSGGTKAASEKPIKKPVKFKNAFYSATVLPDGTLASLAPRGAAELLSGKQFGGNSWLYSENDIDITPKNASAKLVQGPVFDCVESTMKLGSVNMITRLLFYHDLPWFNVETTLKFNEPTEIGDYFNDRTKLHYAWSVGADAQIKHAIGGCSASARPGKTFLVSPWLDIEQKKGGMAICAMNATKCWLDGDGQLRCLVAWGHDGDHFHNRQGPLAGIMGPLNWKKAMDLRLRGEYTVQYAVWPHSKKVEEALVADWAASLLMPPIACNVPAGNGNNPWSNTFLSVNTPGVVPLSIRQGDKGEPILRLMEVEGEEHRLKLKLDNSWRLSSLRNLDGTKIKSVAAHKIVEAQISKG